MHGESLKGFTIFTIYSVVKAVGNPTRDRRINNENIVSLETPSEKIHLSIFSSYFQTNFQA